MSEDRPGLLDGAIWPAENTKLFGHEDAEDFLAQFYRSGKGHHAILVEGPEGIGKATLAFRFANHVLSHPDPATAPERIADPDLGLCCRAGRSPQAPRTISCILPDPWMRRPAR